MRRLPFAALLCISLLSVLLAVSPAQAATEEVDPQIEAMLAEVPGGVVLDAHHAIWPALQMEMVVPPGLGQARLSSVGSCPSGSFCAFDGGSLSGTRLSWTSCGTQTIPSWFFVRSIANARPSGVVRAYGGSVLLGSASAGHWVNVSGKATTVRCSL